MLVKLVDCNTVWSGRSLVTLGDVPVSCSFRIRKRRQNGTEKERERGGSVAPIQRKMVRKTVYGITVLGKHPFKGPELLTMF
jgi:hypothetical protein